MATNWSDHRVILASTYVKKPKVEKASPAPRLPSIETLEKTHKFWPRVLNGWEALSEHGLVTLERWKSFKDEVLNVGQAEVTAMKTLGRKDWVKALRSEHVAPSEIMTTAARANTMLWARRSPPARTAACWPAVIPAYEVIPDKWRGFISSPGSPWPVPMLTAELAHTPRRVIAKGFLKTSLSKGVADLLDEKAMCFVDTTKAKWEKVTRTHSSEWFKQSSNKELDERGSRASVSVEGLRRPNEALAQTGLTEMAMVAKDYFYHLHTPEPTPLERRAAQQTLLEDVRQQSRDRGDPDPEALEYGPFMVAEVKALCAKMPNTAPGPDGIHYGFWKKLMIILDGLQDGATPPRTFWSIFIDVTKDIVLRGSSWEGFKDANISLFFKKGDPTLVSNYRPISSMNTDCKMYTNLLNNRLVPWAIKKLHPDQKGFVPGRLMYEHTQLAAEVAHLCDATETPGFIVGLDQAKAYDRVDQSWLISVLLAFGLPGQLTRLIEDLVVGCRSRVRINSRYSPYFALKRGVRQGDPLSCLLFNFSIEPLAIKLRQRVVGLRVPGLDLVRVMLYADDVNLFLSEEDSVQDISTCLTEVSYAIGSKFNMSKTDVKPVGAHAFQEKCYKNQDMAGPTIPGACILPLADPLWILGVWVGSRDNALHRWTQIDSHIKKIISQWRAIGANVRNRSLLAKALMLSRCHFLMDGNGIPPHVLRRISNRVMGFV